ncbi:MAG: PTPA-CTERM sorting domain-containing protein [Leptolyngbyaceae cyanobacterium SL_5_9]|nr:PTPA-CTERM sorting domain-containing protein [Leptolyngbyaceae cyanobacterium SL_5_9]NJO72534.1 PTPA-CTERM sorting domain-containing protein [Leptolyngbyaceae cyanobacterium RM1_406_9]
MNLTAIKLGAAIAATATAATLMGGAPAEALVVAGDRLNFAGSAQLSDVTVGSNATLSFSDVTIGTNSTFATFGPKNSTITANNLTLNRTGATAWSLISPKSPEFWLEGLNGHQFALTSFNLTEMIGDGESFFRARYTGFFTPPETPGLGTLTSQGEFDIEGSTFSASLRAVPTPALVPAALGFGAAMLRKRKEEEAGKETAEAKA